MVGGITSEDGTVLVDSVKIPDLPTVSSAVMEATVALTIERKILEALKLRRSEVDAGYITRQKRRNTLNSARDKINDSEIQAWCVDYSTEIAPDTKVRTIEVPGYRLKGEPSMVIAPGGSGTSGVKYGQLRSALTMTPETVFLNAALEPGHLKWRPRWRYGQITWISESEDKCHVALEQEWGRRVDVAPKMPLNDKATLENVPIRYMSCNRAAFEVGDWVVVEWKDNEPAVIGFRSEPRSCFPCEIAINHEYTGDYTPGGFARILITIELKRQCGTPADVTRQFYTECAALGGSPCAPVGLSWRLTYFERDIYIDAWYGGALPIKGLTARYGFGDAAVTQAYREESGSLLYQVFRQKLDGG